MLKPVKKREDDRAAAGDRCGIPVRCGSGWENAGAPEWRLGVHIADVSAYVPWGCAIDLDARNRATSVYLVDRVIPMLPERLSNDLCSLRPDEDRLAMTVDLRLDGKGRVSRFEVYPAVIRSKARLTYGEVQKWLDGMGAPAAAPRPCDDDAEAAGETSRQHGLRASRQVVERLESLSLVGKLRAELRRLAGGIDFPSTEAKVRLDADGRPTGVDLRRKTDATSLVEEAMILANEAVAGRR